MKTLYIMRHAKSSWDDIHLPDFERPLNGRGEKAAPFMGKLMAKNSFKPDLIISSPAARAEQTAELVKKNGDFQADIQYNEKIYEATPLRLIELVSEIDDGVNSVLLVGHNPGLEGLIRFLTGELRSLPTAALAILNVKADSWSTVEADCCTLKNIFKPREEMKSAAEN